MECLLVIGLILIAILLGSLWLNDRLSLFGCLIWMVIAVRVIIAILRMVY